jgi:hypothetical protein
MSLAWGSVSIVEILWTLMGIFGMYFSWRNMQDARLYVIAIEKLDGNNLARANEMRIIAFGHYRNEILRLCKFSVVISVGVAAMIAKPADPAAPISPLSLIITIGLFALVGLMSAASALDRRQRDLLMHLTDD